MRGHWKALRLWQRIALIVAAVTAVLLIAAWIASILLRPQFPTHQEVVAQARAQVALTGGEKPYVAHCAACHARGIAPSLTGRGLDTAMLSGFVRMGPGAMPAFPKSSVSDADIAAIQSYLASQPAVIAAPAP